MPETVAPEFIALQQAVAGRYSLERELGRGGMGIVFLARDVALDRLVAIKLLPQAYAADAGHRERFLTEARTAAKLSQPNIVPIHSVEEAAGLVFFVMSYLEGETLGQRLRAKGPLTPHEAARMIQETAWALGYAHGRGVVHRDVKPDNIMLERGTGRAIVMDFGIAGAPAGADARVVGTAQYMSPEQANGDAVDGRSDLYSLGVVGFLALTGRLPFEAEDPSSILAMHITKPAPPVASVSPGLPRRLAQAVDRCLAKAPEDRFPDGEALAEAVGQSVERQRELPAPVRLWLTKNAQPTVVHLVWVSFVSFPSLVGGITMIYQGSLLVKLGGVGLLGLALGGPFGVTALYRVIEARRLLRSGYGLEDMRLAVRMAAQRRREELAVEFDREPPLPAKILRWTTITAGLTASAFLIASIVDAMRSGGNADRVITVFLGSSLVFGAGAMLHTFFPGARQTKDRLAELRARAWQSTIGQWIVKLASWKLKHRAVPAELTYRPTEMAIGLAADALFESLPKEQRRELRALPSVIERLQADAALMRRTVDELNGALAGLGDQSASARSSALAADAAGVALARSRDALHADLTTKRDEAGKRLAAAVASLESIRLSLLRLKAGTGSVGELTADLTAARSLTDRMAQDADAQAEVERLLATTREFGLTPPHTGPQGA